MKSEDIPKIDYFTFFCAFMGYGIYHNGKKIYKNEAYKLVQLVPEIFKDIKDQRNGFLLVEKSGWTNGIITNPSEL